MGVSSPTAGEGQPTLNSTAHLGLCAGSQGIDLPALQTAGLDLNITGESGKDGHGASAGVAEVGSRSSVCRAGGRGPQQPCASKGSCSWRTWSRSVFKLRVEAGWVAQ